MKNYIISIKQQGSIYWIEFRYIYTFYSFFGKKWKGSKLYLAEIKNNTPDWTSWKDGAQKFTSLNEAKKTAYRIEWLILQEQQTKIEEVAWESSDLEETKEKFKAFQKFAIEAGDDVADKYFFDRMLEFDLV